ncbi:MAG TPA: hypothetical protein VG077_00560, partial [Verrucomicrobiae bacterium]|nr:hypothetical protein [Verrucomicrobiae bacterium]
MNDVVFVKILAVITAIVFLVILFRYSSSKPDPESQRRKDLAALARKLRLKFDFKSSFELANEYSFLRWLTRGDISYVYNIFYGYYSGYAVTVFDYTFAAGQANYYWSAFILKMKTNFPDIIISHESM